jgi:hypothetical protein
MRLENFVKSSKTLVEALLALGITKCKWMQTKFPFFNVFFFKQMFFLHFWLVSHEFSVRPAFQIQLYVYGYFMLQQSNYNTHGGPGSLELLQVNQT